LQPSSKPGITSYPQGMLPIRFGAILFVATLATAQETSAPSAAKFRVPEPRLPVIDHNGCPGQGRTIPHFKIQRADRLYSSWQGKRVLAGTLKAGDEVTILAGLNIIREPDRAVVVNPLDAVAGSPPKPGDLVLRFGLNGDSDWKYWSKGVWFTESCEKVVEKGSECGFADKTQCTIAITRNGVKERWLRVGTGTGRTGWVLAGKSQGDKMWASGNFGSVCGCD
jgi:hypothetical protein